MSMHALGRDAVEGLMPQKGSIFDQSVETILQTKGLYHRFIVYYASQCAKHVKNQLKDKRSLEALDIAERYGNGEHFTQEYLSAASYAASYAASAASAAASYASAAASYASYAASAASAASAAASAASNRTSAFDTKGLLLSLIQQRLSKLEQMLIFGEEVHSV